jgi:hypothetical protein
MDTICLGDAARAATTMGQFRRTRDYLQRWRALEPEDGALHADFGALDIAENRPLASLSHLNKSLSLDWRGNKEKRDRACALLALAHLQCGDSAIALRLIEAVIGRRPEWESAHWLRQQILVKQGGKAGRGQGSGNPTP